MIRCFYHLLHSAEKFSRIRSDLADVEISKFVSGIVGGKSTASRNNPRRCYRTSTSSGYSSHSPPLSAGSYSYYASASTRDPSYGGLAVIHESEAIPRPIWPSVIYHSAEDHSGDYEGNEKRVSQTSCRTVRNYSVFPGKHNRNPENI